MNRVAHVVGAHLVSQWILSAVVVFAGSMGAAGLTSCAHGGGSAPIRCFEESNFDAWYAAIDRPVDIEAVRLSSFKEDTVVGYAVNDLLLRTPAYLAVEAWRHGMGLVALPYYGVRFIASGSGWTAPSSPGHALSQEDKDNHPQAVHPQEHGGGHSEPGS